MKIKVFKFEVSNASSNVVGKDKEESWYYEKQRRLHGEHDIEVVINDFINNKNVVKISINTIETHYHNNGRGNTIHLIYTILYQE